MICSICPRKCNVDRSKKLGFCQSPDNFRVARASLHYWEEPCISGKQGSGAVFFSGCNLKCVFCQNNEISSQNKGVEITEEKLIEIFESLIKQGANNINLVNPTHYALQIANVLKKWKSPVPIVYNSSGYEEVETLKELDGLIDIYLPDFKYSDNKLAKRLSKVDNYFEITTEALKEMHRQTGKAIFDDRGIMKKGMIIRHLVLPNHILNSRRVLKWINDNMNDVYVSVMAQYFPTYKAKEIEDINRKLTKEEYNQIENYLYRLNLENGYIQELGEHEEEYVPKWEM